MRLILGMALLCIVMACVRENSTPPSLVVPTPDLRAPELVCHGLWTPPPPRTCAAEGAACDDQNPCTYNDTCRNGWCQGVPDSYCTPCRTVADCCGPNQFVHCLRPSTRALVVAPDERRACTEGHCLLITVEHEPSCAKLPLHGSEEKTLF